MTAVEFTEVTKIFNPTTHPVAALRDVTLALEPGELVAVMGPSGSGKSTLLNLAGGLDDPTSGQVTVSGQQMSGASAAQRARLRRRAIGFVFQDYNLIPSLTAAENVAMPLELDGMSRRQARAAAMSSLADVGLPDALDRFPDELSGGERQRVAIARAVVGPRDLILADEPTGALDSVTGEEVLHLLRARCDAGVACLLVTHESRHAAWADRILLLRDGCVVDHAEFRGVPSDLAGLR